ncbi:MAG: M20/M25/M40 family metallo-hydrolase [Deltaproteobacteria bacterium]|nr:M20/M25/M40 family metallo-hydrolase [Deltaproteobacteria bacterium]
MKEKIRQLMTELTALSGPAGFENKVVLYLRDKVKGLADSVEIDAFGNMMALRKGSSDHPSVMIAAHMDEIGLMVKRIETNGFIKFTCLGYPNPIVLAGRGVLIDGRHYGVIGARAWHTTPPEERNKLPKLDSLYIDVGAKDDEEVMKMGIGVGSSISFDGEFRQLGDTDCYAGKAIDDRLGCALLVLLLEALSGVDLAGPVYACFTVQEEVGLRGAAMSAYQVNPDFAIALDNCVAEDTPEQSAPSKTSVVMGKGPSINVKEFMPEMILGAIHHPALVAFVEEVAKKNKIPYQKGMLIGGVTDAQPIHLTRGGIPTIYMGTPSRYAHSQVETIDLNDIEQTINLLVAIVKAIKPDTAFKMV